MTSEINILATAGLVVVHENKILLTYSKNKQAWYLPGGKIASGETPLQTIIREIKEELNVELDPSLLQPYGKTKVKAYGQNENVMMDQSCFLYPYLDKIQVQNEIGDFAYMDYTTYLQQEAQVPGVLAIFDRLKNDKLLKY